MATGTGKGESTASSAGVIDVRRAIRASEIVPRLAALRAMDAETCTHGERGLAAVWTLGDGSRLACLANLGGSPFAQVLPGRALFALGQVAEDRWAIQVSLQEGAG